MLENKRGGEFVNKFVFDVDGTLTPSRQSIDPKFSEFFLEFCNTHDVYLVTGSDKDKTVEQLGEELYNIVKVAYNCSGNDVYSHGVNIRSNNWTAPESLITFLQGRLQTSSFPLRTGNHIEQRPGCLNFSIIGRNCTLEQRKDYIKHDLSYRERESIAFQVNFDYEDLTAAVGGETGIDIYPTGFDKSQIIKDFNSFDRIIFFGDKIEQGGNDYPLAKILKHPSRSHTVKDWQDTWMILKENY